ncbi:hypothetical protein ACX80W_14760 [Arthrobacter sp. TMN-37]
MPAGLNRQAPIGVCVDRDEFLSIFHRIDDDPEAAAAAFEALWHDVVLEVR